MKTARNLLLSGIAITLASCGSTTTKVTSEKGIPQTQYAASLVDNYIPSMQKGYKINIKVADENSGLAQEGFTIKRKGKKIDIIGNDASGAIYGTNRLLEYFNQYGNLETPEIIVDTPEMKIRGACVGLQKTVYLPGHKVYEYPYTPENFPWFYDKELWIKLSLIHI